jgi:hypothetical protein
MMAPISRTTVGFHLTALAVTKTTVAILLSALTTLREWDELAPMAELLLDHIRNFAAPQEG